MALQSASDREPFYLYQIPHVKTWANLVNCNQFSKFFANVHDEARDHTICVVNIPECMCEARHLNVCMK